MSTLVSLSISIGILAGIMTWGFLSPWSGPILVWAAFVAWGCFYHCGGDNAALKNTIVGNFFGVVCAWIAALGILGIPLAETLTLPVWAGIVVGVVVVVVVLAAHIQAFAVIPASVYGFAAAFAFLLQTPEKLSLGALTSASMDNVVIVVPISMIIGALFAIGSAKLGGAMTKAAE